MGEAIKGNIAHSNLSRMALEEYIAFWDAWHSAWVQRAAEEVPNGEPIQGLAIFPDERWKLFPEPYWGKIDPKHHLKGVFLNINPGLSGEPEDALEIRYPFSGTLLQYFNGAHGSYNSLVNQLSDIRDYETTKWMLRKRAKWFYNLINQNEQPNLNQLLIADLFPWHTPKKSDLRVYQQLQGVIDFLRQNVIEPLALIAMNNVQGFLEGKVIVRSSMILDLVNQHASLQDLFHHTKYYVVTRMDKPLDRFSSVLTVLEHVGTGAKFLVFSEGASMELPNPTYSVREISGIIDNIELRRFIQEL